VGVRKDVIADLRSPASRAEITAMLCPGQDLKRAFALLKGLKPHSDAKPRPGHCLRRRWPRERPPPPPSQPQWQALKQCVTASTTASMSHPSLPLTSPALETGTQSGGDRSGDFSKVPSAAHLIKRLVPEGPAPNDRS